MKLLATSYCLTITYNRAGFSIDHWEIRCKKFMYFAHRGCGTHTHLVCLRHWYGVYVILLQTSFKTSNQFSAHDNRDVLASDAEYFGVVRYVCYICWVRDLECVRLSTPLQSWQWVMGQMGQHIRMGHMGHKIRPTVSSVPLYVITECTCLSAIRCFTFDNTGNDFRHLVPAGFSGARIAAVCDCAESCWSMVV